MNEKSIRALVMQGRKSFADSLGNLPSIPKNAHQRQMAKSRAGSPAHFATLLENAIGEISIDEATKAIAKYLREWNKKDY